MKKIAIIDDDKILLSCLVEIIKLIDGFQIYSFVNAREAYSFLEKNRDIKAVLIDYNMSEINAKEFIEIIKKFEINCKIGIMSGYLKDEIEGSLKQTKVDVIIQKPFNIEIIHNFAKQI